MTRTFSEKMRLGIFVITGAFLLLAAIYLIGNNRELFSKTFTLTSVFSNVNGLQKGNNVRFSGIDVGTVKKIEMENDTVIRIYMIIEEQMLEHIRKNAVATISSDGLVGNMIVNIIPGKNTSENVKDGDEIPSYSRIGVDDVLNTLNVTNENAALLTADLLKITNSLTRGKGTLGRLLNDTIMAAELKQTVTNLKHTGDITREIARELYRITEDIRFEESVAGTLLADTLAGNQIKNFLTYLEISGEGIHKTICTLNELAAQIKDGQGAVNYLATDTLFVRQLEKTMLQVEEGTYRFNENMEALKHNFLFRGYFRKQERKSKKVEKKN